ncbi:hypothetical protein NECAME_00795 [Necator americanus]|uniref:Replication termination factor 2 n=1 Tax=Necator americanus TaxID=51031 RepID=W2SXU5_NECAM|nr:hypothetical protein NECAME_00795 [Necator americanus]ETN73706.1 hypothetical protein NECAME_00795 [Necator americanus]
MLYFSVNLFVEASMGADGGTIPKRCELVKKKKKAEKLDKSVKNATKWKNCQLSQQPLKKPIIVCRYGRLYNKETVIEAILTKTIQNFEVASHIRGMKDFKELRLKENKDYKGDEVKGDEYLDSNQSEFLCPVTTLPMNGINSFVVNWKCGCVFSEKALQEVKSDVCHRCSGPWDPKDSVVLYPNEELLEEYKQKVAAERTEKKNKKKNGDEKLNGYNSEKNAAGTKEVKKQEHDHKKGEEKDKLKKGEKRKAESDIQSDPTKSEAYKKLFTTCKEAKNKPTQHWVTYNPLYY